LIEADWTSNLGFYKNRDFGPILARFPRGKRSIDAPPQHSAAWIKFMTCTNQEVEKVFGKQEQDAESSLEQQCRVVEVAYNGLLKCYNTTGFTNAEIIAADTMFRNMKYVRGYCSSDSDKQEALNKKKLEDECVKKALSSNSDKMKNAEQEYSTFFHKVLDEENATSKEEMLCQLAVDFSRILLPYLKACGLTSQRIEYEVGKIYLGTISMTNVDDPIPFEACFSNHGLNFEQHFLL